MIHDYARFEEREVPEDSPALDTSFHDHETGRDAAGLSDRHWSNWCTRVEKLLGIESLDGDYNEDGYCLDFAYDEYKRGATPREYATEVALTLQWRIGNRLRNGDSTYRWEGCHPLAELHNAWHQLAADSGLSAVEFMKLTQAVEKAVRA